MSEPGTTSTEELQTTTEPLNGDGGSSNDGKSTPSQKRPRTEAQMHALLKAREKALMVRQQNADLKRKQQEIDRATLAKAKQDERERIEREYKSLQRPQVAIGSRSDPHAPPPPIDEEEENPESSKIREKPRKKKPARRVVVTEASSGSETEEEVEVQLPRQRRPRSAEQIAYQRSMSKMFEYQ